MDVTYFTSSLLAMTFMVGNRRFSELVKGPERKEDPALSRRANARMREEGAGMSYLPDFLNSLSNQYHKETNPRGVIAMCVAENNLEAPKQAVADQMEKSMQGIKESSRDILNYTATTGMPCLRKALATLFNRYIFRGSHEAHPDQIFVAAGASAVITNLAFVLFDEGDSILIPAPYYAGFDADFKAVPGCATVPLHLPLEEKFRLTEVALEQGYQDSCAAGNNPRALLLNNPNNPLGRVYSVEELRMARRWCRSKSMHLICDEVFALSVWQRPEDPGDSFQSLPVALGSDFDEYCHVIWAVSKDLCASGLRLGTLYTQNKSVMAALGNTNIMAMTSNLLQVALTKMISDDSWVASFVETNRKALHSCYDELNKALPAFQVNVTPAIGGIFVWADFRAHLLAPTFEEEQKLYTCLASSGILLTPGEACHCAHPGFFRICYAWVPSTDLDEAIKRIIRGVAKYTQKS